MSDLNVQRFNFYITKIKSESTLMLFKGASLGSDLLNGGGLEIKQHVGNIRASNLKIYLFS